MESFIENGNHLSDKISIISYPYLTNVWLMNNLYTFVAQYPDISIKVDSDTQEINLIDYDVGIGKFIPDQSHLVQRELFSASTYLFASKEYLQEYGVPRTPKDLDNHRLIAYQDQQSYYSIGSLNLLLTCGLEPFQLSRKPRIQINCLEGMIKAALEGLGIAELPNYESIMSLGLERVLPEIKGDNIPIYFIYQKNSEDSKKIQALYEHLFKVSEKERIDK